MDDYAVTNYMYDIYEYMYAHIYPPHTGVNITRNKVPHLLEIRAKALK